MSIETESSLLQAIRKEINWAEDDQNRYDIDKALDYYDAKLPTPMEDDSGNDYSDVVSPEVRNAVEATLAEVMPGFYGDTPVVFLPNGPMDEKQASDETKIVNHVFLVANNGYTVLNRAFKDAMVCKTAVVRVSWEVCERVEGQRLRNVDLATMAMIQDTVTGAEQDEQGTYTADVANRQVEEKPTVEWVPIDQLLVNSDHDETTLDNARFVAQRRQVPASDLVAIGYDEDLIQSLSHGTEDIDAYSRRHENVENQSAHDSTRPITVAECYYRIDLDGDGIAELNRVIVAGGNKGSEKVLGYEPWDEQPFAMGVAFYAPRGWRGVSLTERLSDIQDYKSDMMRQILDAGWRNLSQRVTAVERMVNIDDLMTSRTGGIVRVKDPAAVNPLPDVSLPHQSFALLEQLDKMRREAGGGAIDVAPQAQEMGADSAHGVERIMSAIEETNAMVAKNLAETLVTQIYQKLHRLLRKHWRGVISAKVQGNWLEQVPQQWAHRNDTDVAVGLSTGIRMRQAQNIMQIIGMQQQDMQTGMDGVLVGLPQMHSARVDLARLMGIKYPEKYWVDPSSPEAQQAQQAKQQAAEQQAQQQAELAQQQAQLMQSLEQIKAQSDQTVAKIRADTDQYKTDIQHIQKTVDQRLKLIELNAEHDDEEVPDTTKAVSNG